MRLPIRVATAVRARKLILPGQRVLVALSGGPDSVALLRCLQELSQKRDLAFTLAAAHLHHGLRGKSADADEEFCRKLCKRRGIPLIRAYVNTPKLAASLARSKEETARIARHAFLNEAARRAEADVVAVAHHADDRIETVIYRLCRGTGLAGLQGIGWTGPVKLAGEPDVDSWIQWRDDEASSKSPPAKIAPENFSVVRPFLGSTRQEVLAYLKLQRQKYCTDETNFDVYIPRNAVRNLVLPLLEQKVHPGTRAALWRLAEEAEVHAEKRAWRREWLTAFADAGKHSNVQLPVPRIGPPPEASELSDVLEVLKVMWGLKSADFSHRHVQALRRLFVRNSGPRSTQLPAGIVADRRGKVVTLRRNYSARELL
jgi:tRNA(Ile)-lysidine synthase